MSSRGFSLTEALVAIFLLGIAAASILPAFMVQMDSNSRGEVRAGAVTAAQRTLETLRNQDLDTMPDPVGAGDPASTSQQTTVGDLEFDVTTRFCDRTEFCPPASLGSRHITVEVNFDGQLVYQVETVFTQLR